MTVNSIEGLCAKRSETKRSVAVVHLPTDVPYVKVKQGRSNNIPAVLPNHYTFRDELERTLSSENISSIYDKVGPASSLTERKNVWIGRSRENDPCYEEAFRPLKPNGVYQKQSEVLDGVSSPLDGNVPLGTSWAHFTDNPSYENPLSLLKPTPKSKPKPNHVYRNQSEVLDGVSSPTEGNVSLGTSWTHTTDNPSYEKPLRLLKPTTRPKPKPDHVYRNQSEVLDGVSSPTDGNVPLGTSWTHTTDNPSYEKPLKPAPKPKPKPDHVYRNQSEVLDGVSSPTDGNVSLGTSWSHTTDNPFNKNPLMESKPDMVGPI